MRATLTLRAVVEEEHHHAGLAIRTDGSDLQHRLLLVRVLPPLICDGNEVLEGGWREDDGTGEDRSPLVVELEDKLRDDAEVGAAAADAPEEVGVLLVASFEDGAVGCDDGDLVQG